MTLTRSSFPALLAFVCLAVGSAIAAALYRETGLVGGASGLSVAILIAILVASSVKVASACVTEASLSR